ncbi:glycosyltransferase family 87 protein [Roseibium hamelinense]|nr:glycosyltransferase family 87 protein [Roseibium hamelinense]
MAAFIDHCGGRLFAVAVLVSCAATAIFLAALSGPIFLLPASLFDAASEDLAAFYRAGQMALQGIAAKAYEPTSFRLGLGAENDELLYLNPPYALFFFQPLALMPYWVAKLFFLLATAVLLALIGWQVWPDTKIPAAAVLMLSPAAFYSLDYLQLAPVFVLLIVAGLLVCKERPLLAGILLALATIKPQYGLLVPVFLLGVRAWTAIICASCFTLALIAASAAFYGVELWAVFIHSLTEGAHSAHLNQVFPLMVSVDSSIGKLGADPALRRLIQGAAILLAAVIVYRTARAPNRRRAIGLTMLCIPLAAPSFALYDWAFICAGLMMVMPAQQPHSSAFQAHAAHLWLFPLLYPFVNWAASAEQFAVLALYSACVPLLVAVVLASLFLSGQGKPMTRVGASGSTVETRP